MHAAGGQLVGSWWDMYGTCAAMRRSGGVCPDRQLRGGHRFTLAFSHWAEQGSMHNSACRLGGRR